MKETFAKSTNWVGQMHWDRFRSKSNEAEGGDPGSQNEKQKCSHFSCSNEALVLAAPVPMLGTLGSNKVLNG